MNLLLLIVSSMVVLFLGYRLYGNFLSRMLGLRDDVPTPAYTLRDDVDFVPAGKWYLLGQHFSAIAAAGPIVGPILAGMWFGWLPTLLWILLGGIFVGGVHDMLTVAASVRHQGKSIAEVLREYMSKRGYILFLLFLWFSLVYIITTFMDITAGTFTDPVRGAGVASSSMMYLGLAVVMGVILRKFNPPLGITSLVFLPLVFVAVFLGPHFPIAMPSIGNLDPRTLWNSALLFYCFIAAVIPMWLLLQPRGYLGGFFLTLMVGVSLLGIIVGNFIQPFVIQYPAFTGWISPGGFPLLPILFTTVACGACSGFHAMVASGTTSKQIAKESDIKLVGYGGLLLESFVAVIALATVLILTVSKAGELQDPNQIFANGVSVFLSRLGVPTELALNFALLAFATFVYDTLDVATRLGRYIFEELTGWRGKWSPYVASLITLILPAIFVTTKMTDASGHVIPAWKMFWSVFGSSNQLLAALVLLTVSLWLFKNKMRYKVALWPAFFMMIVAMFSLFFILKPWVQEMFLLGRFIFNPMGITGALLAGLALLLLFEGACTFVETRAPKDETTKNKNFEDLP
ncbi:MAG: carbon starvation CstA family protein [Candidatus Omnitrophica bacterium]|nr:carbon starvation CstA family protein [Candidatus Omnitrophota bacterium]